MPAEHRARIEASRPRLYQTARDQYGLVLNAGSLAANSRPALIGAKYAEAHGVGDAYHSAVFRAFWQEAQDISSQAVLADIAGAVGLAPADFLAGLAAPVHLAAVQSDVAQARAYGLNAVPAMVFADRYLVSGAQPYVVLRQAVEQIGRGG